MSMLLQFTLGLFESRPEQPQATKPKTRKPPARKARAPESPDRQVSDHQATLELWSPPGSGDGLPSVPSASQPSCDSSPQLQPDGPGVLQPDRTAQAVEVQTQTLEQALAPVTFCHPRASREAMLAGTLVAYEFKRGKRRTIGFSVGPEGLAVRAPKWVPLYEVDKAVLDKSAWILQKLQETRQRHHRLQSARIEWKNGAQLAYLGGMLKVVLDPQHGFSGVGAQLVESAGHASQPPNTQAEWELRVSLSHRASPDQIRDAVQAWLMRQAAQNFVERLNYFAPRLGVVWRKFSLSSAGTRWGSASSDGAIRLNWHLIHFRQAVIDYVVVHELSHLRVMNHSPQFWETVREVVPDYLALRTELKSDAIPQW